MSLSRWYSSFNVCNFLNWQDLFINWSTKLIFFCQNLVKLTIELSIIICLLNQRLYERMPKMISGYVDRYFFQFSKIFLQKHGKRLTQQLLNDRFEWNFSSSPNDILINFRGINFHSWKESSESIFIQEDWRIAIFLFISTFLRPSSLKSEDIVLFLIFSWDFNHHWNINNFWNNKGFKNYNFTNRLPP